MFDDLPKKSSLRKLFSFFIFLVILGGLGYFGYQKYSTSASEVTPKVLPTKIIDSYTPGSPAPTSAGLTEFRVPSGETYIASSATDTNGDGKIETLVVTRQPDGNYHAYVLGADKTVLFDHKNMIKLPARVSIQKYSPTETYSSWELVLRESPNDLFFIHWNGTAYEIPK